MKNIEELLEAAIVLSKYATNKINQGPQYQVNDLDAVRAIETVFKISEKIKGDKNAVDV